VTELKPGLKYAFRVTCNPKASLARRPVEAAGPSHPAVFRTTPAAPSAPNPITLGSKERKALKVMSGLVIGFEIGQLRLSVRSDGSLG
jgi:hypothetical protein